MARGLDKHNARKLAVSALGRGLARRASNRCELCNSKGPLAVVEVAPTLDEPDESRAVLVCPRCTKAMEGGRHGPPADQLRFLTEVIWSQTLPAQLVAVRLTRRLAAEGAPWARSTLDDLYLDETIAALLGDPA